MTTILVLGYRSLGGIVKILNCIKLATPHISPLLLLDEDGADYGHVLSNDRIIRSRNTKNNHKLLIEELEERLSQQNEKLQDIIGIINLQDSMWPCYMMLSEAIKSASTYISPQIINRTSVKPNLRSMLRHTSLDTQYEILTKEEILSDSPFDSNEKLAKFKNCSHLILKPIMGSASSAVAKIAFGDNSMLKSAGQTALDFAVNTYGEAYQCLLFDAEVPLGPHEAVLIEEYIEGRELSIEGVADGGARPQYLIQQWKATLVEMPSFKDLEYVVQRPTSVDPAVRDSIEDLLKTLDYRNKAFHIEMRINESGIPKILEFNPRPGGGSIFDLFYAIHGIDVISLPLCLFLNSLKNQNYYFVTRVIQPKDIGMLVEYRGIMEVESQPDCLYLHVLVSPGSFITSVASETYLIEFCVYGENEQLARQRAIDLERKIEVLIANTKI